MFLLSDNCPYFLFTGLPNFLLVVDYMTMSEEGTDNEELIEEGSGPGNKITIFNGGSYQGEY